MTQRDRQILEESWKGYAEPMSFGTATLAAILNGLANTHGDDFSLERVEELLKHLAWVAERMRVVLEETRKRVELDVFQVTSVEYDMMRWLVDTETNDRPAGLRELIEEKGATTYDDLMLATREYVARRPLS